MSTAILITARMKSTRLKEKVLKPIMGKPMLYHMIERLRLAKIPEKIIVCTSTVKQDDRLEEFAEKEGVECFRGHPDDVLLRMRDAAEEHDVDRIVSCTGDNPFVDPEYIDKLIRFHESEGNDYSKVDGLPFGTFSYVLNAEAVEHACKIKDVVDTEVWGGYFIESNLFRWSVLSVKDKEVYWPELRLTVDTPEDFHLIKEIFNCLYSRFTVFSLHKIIELCRENPRLMKINSNIKQATPKPIRIRNIN